MEFTKSQVTLRKGDVKLAPLDWVPLSFMTPVLPTGEIPVIMAFTGCVTVIGTVGYAVGGMLGLAVDGLRVTPLLVGAEDDGSILGASVGKSEGDWLGMTVGREVGALDGRRDG